MANVYLNGGGTYSVAETVRAGSFGLMEEGRFTATATVNGVAYRVEATGSGFAYVNGRLAVPAGSDSVISSLRLFDAGGIERYSITNLATGTLGFQTLVEARDYSGTFDLLHAGDDLVRVGPDANYVSGGPGADTLFGDGRSNRYFIEDSTDRVVEPANGGERDYVEIGYGATGELLSFALGAGRLAGIEFLSYEGDARVRVVGNGFANEIYAGGDNDTVSGGGGNDTLSGYDGDDSLSGGAGDDSLDGGFGRDSLLGGTGHDTIVSSGEANRIDGGAGDDVIAIFGMGADTLSGGAGADTIRSSTSGNSRLLGGVGNDSIMASIADTLDGGAGNDTLIGGSGRDTLDGGTGADRMIGGGGDDSYLVDHAGDRIT
ncbi:MAG: hypothetical protein KIT81_10420, partial [Alphaproteobacteria bacterium]|nr:hypothetical protein [Alphaproteobacteria bacterium]